MNRTIIAAALSLSSVFAPLAAHAGAFRGERFEHRAMIRPAYAAPLVARPVFAPPAYAQPVYSQPVYSQPVYAQPVFAERLAMRRPMREGWRMERGHAIVSGRVGFGHGRW